MAIEDGYRESSAAWATLLRDLKRRGMPAPLLAVVGALFDPARFFRAYLFAYLFWLEIALGSLAIVLFLPLLLGLDELYPWARPEVVAADSLLQHKQLYLNVPFFLVRLALYFAIWIGLAFFLNRWSREQERGRDSAFRLRLRRLSGPGIVLYALAATFASFDWMIHWSHTGIRLFTA